MRKTTLLIGLLALTTIEGSEMRATKFKDVLHAVARKAGYSPESGNFLTNQAIPVGEYINEWVGRLYSDRDWPEWTKVVRIAPGSDHIVPYRVLQGGPASTVTPFNIWRVIDVYLMDPATVRNPPRTKFTLREDGIHCGYEHGTYVWIKFIEPAPTFTAVVWEADQTYQRDNVVYVDQAGECYSSKINNNIGHDPVANVDPPPHLTLEETQALVPAEPGLAAQDQITDIFVLSIPPSTVLISDPVPIGVGFTIGLFDLDGNTIDAHSADQFGTDSITTMLTSLKTQFDAALLPGFTFTVDGPNRKLRIESDTTAFVVGFWNYVNPDGTFFPMKWIQVQQLQLAVASTDVTPQQIKVTIGDNSFIPGALYTMYLTDTLGNQSSVEYQSTEFDNKNQILNGLLAAIGASTDANFANVSGILDTSEPSLTLSLMRTLGVDASVSPTANQFWDLVPFPEALFNPVVRGATADLLGEWGQTDKQEAQEGKVGAEAETVAADFNPMPTAPLTTQERPYSRYKY